LVLPFFSILFRRRALGIVDMDPIYVPLLSALAGAIIGSLSSIATILIQAKVSDRRENGIQKRIQKPIMLFPVPTAIGQLEIESRLPCFEIGHMEMGQPLIGEGFLPCAIKCRPPRPRALHLRPAAFARVAHPIPTPTTATPNGGKRIAKARTRPDHAVAKAARRATAS
jgi:hypothetical protein